jgi:uncharacterized protein YdhG (YjbR/CyaY superfamily)
MQSKAQTVAAYLSELPADRKQAMTKIRAAIKRNLPTGFAEAMSYGMISYCVPLSTYAAGYHVKPNTPLPFISVASQKNFIAVYHMGLYGDPAMLSWFKKAYADADIGRLDMGKSCIRFSKTATIPYDLLAELAGKMSPAQYISRYEKAIGRKS